jgi:Fe-S cluster assembly protein SufD
MTMASIADQFERHRAQLADAALPVRRRALDRFLAQGLPGRAVEAWRYTDLTAVNERNFAFLDARLDPNTLATLRDALVALGLDADAARLVYVDGLLVEPLSTWSAEPNLAVAPLASDPVALLAAERDDATALESLNTALARDGAAIEVTGPLDRPVHLIFASSGDGLAPQLRMRVELARGARASFVQHLIALPGAGESWLNLVTQIALAESSTLEFHRLQRSGPNCYVTAMTRVDQAAESSFVAGNVELGGRLARNDIEIRLDGERATATLFGVAVTRERQHCDTRILVDHRAAHTVSRQDYRALAADRSRSVFNGKVIVRQHAQHIDARQRNDNLLLSPQAEIDTKPELEIYADQVVCSHGATIGDLDDDQLFYLRSRGVDEQSARNILAMAFVTTILDRFESEPIRNQATAAVIASLPDPTTHR